MKKYQIIYADPPWAMVGKGELTPNYPVMTLVEIKSIPIGNFTEPNCALFLWAINSQIPQAIEVLNSWGFDYKTIGFVWIKVSKKTGKQNCRLGSWTLNGTEMCLLGVKGKMPRLTKNVRQIIECPRGRHSEKPEEVRYRILQLFGDLPRIELFARQKTEGWDIWGNEVKSDIDLANKK